MQLDTLIFSVIYLFILLFFFFVRSVKNDSHNGLFRTRVSDDNNALRLFGRRPNPQIVFSGRSYFDCRKQKKIVPEPRSTCVLVDANFNSKNLDRFRSEKLSNRAFPYK